MSSVNDPQVQMLIMIATGLAGGPIGFAILELLKAVGLKKRVLLRTVSGLISVAIAVLVLRTTGLLPWVSVPIAAVLAFGGAFGTHKVRKKNESRNP